MQMPYLLNMVACASRRGRIPLPSRSARGHARLAFVALFPALIAGCWDLEALEPEPQYVWGAQDFTPEESEELEVPYFVASAGMISQGSQTELSLWITEAEPGRTFAWSVRSGACHTTGTPVTEAPGAFPVVEVNEFGEGQVGRLFGFSLPEDQTYAAEVYDHPREPEDEPLACGTMERHN